MFSRIGAAAIKKDITNTVRICEALGNPQQKFKTVHVGGTNGKGSTSHMLASVLQEAGYKAGLYTSPHLKSFTERIKINGEEVPEPFVVDFVSRVEPLINDIRPSFFEITVAMAFDYFAKSSVDIAVIEVGLGGRLDSTNVISPVVSLITNIGWDHKDLLGDSLEKIASEKAGIIKHKTPAVVSEFQPEVASVFEQKAMVESSPLHFASTELHVSHEGETVSIYQGDRLLFERVNLPLRGFYQRKNLPGVLKCLQILNENGFRISEQNIASGLENVIANTGFKGRWQILRDRPLMVCDTGHNIDGIREVVAQIQKVKYRRLHIVFGTVKDKDEAAVFRLLPKQASYYFCQAKIPRAMNAKELQEKALAFGLQGEAIPDVNEAKNTALKNASQDDFIFIGGSTFVVAEIDEL